MSTTTTIHPSDPLTWKQADTDVHVATRGGEFAGFVEFDGAAHVVRDSQGADLGAFDDLDQARAALESTLDDAATAAETPEAPADRRRAAPARRRPRRARA